MYLSLDHTGYPYKARACAGWDTRSVVRFVGLAACFRIFNQLGHVNAVLSRCYKRTAKLEQRQLGDDLRRDNVAMQICHTRPMSSANQSRHVMSFKRA